MRVGWLADEAAHTGGAELTQAEFRTAAPRGVEIVDCRPGEEWDADRFVIHNCVGYSLDDLRQIKSKPALKFWHDTGPWLGDGVRDWLHGFIAPSEHLFCSPMQATFMGYDGAIAIPPPVDLARFREAATHVNGDRSGSVSVASWRNAGKGQRQAMKWGRENGGVDFYGGGALAPPGSMQMAYEGMPALLARYRTFVFLPTVIEPFGRLVAEAWAAGCEIVTNGLVGAGYWIQENPGAIETAAEDFWQVVLA